MSSLVQLAEKSTAARFFALLDYSNAMKAIAIAYLLHDKRYRFEGYGTAREFIEQRAGMSYRQGLRYREIGDAFLEMFPVHPAAIEATIDGDGSILPVAIEQKEDYEKMAAFLQSIGMEKFRRLISYGADLKELSGGKALRLEGGDEVTVDELLSVPLAELNRKLDMANDALDDARKRIRDQEMLIQEKDKLRQSEQADLRAQVDQLRELDALFTGKAANIETKGHYLGLATAHLAKIMNIITNANIQREDPAGIQAALADFIGRLGKLHADYREQFAFTVEAAE